MNREDALLCDAASVTRFSRHADELEAALRAPVRSAATSRVYLCSCGIMSTMMVPWVFSLRLLRVLDLGDNALGHLGGPAVWATCFNLCWLRLDNNKLQSLEAVVGSIYLLPSLQVLSVRGNECLTDTRRELLERLPRLWALDGYLVADAERWAGASAFALPERYAPLSRGTALRRGSSANEPLAAIAEDVDAIIASLRRRAAFSSPAAQIQRMWRGHTARKATKQRAEEHRWMRRAVRTSALIAADQRRQNARGTVLRSFKEGRVFSAADALIVMKRSLAKWLRRRNALIEAVRRSGGRSLVVRSSETHVWSTIMHNLQVADPRCGGPAVADATGGSPVAMASLRPLDAFRMLRAHPQLVTPERREGTLPLVVESRCVVVPNMGIRRHSEVAGIAKREVVTTCYNAAVMSAEARIDAVRRAVVVRQRLTHASVSSCSHPLALLTVLDAALIGKLVHHALIYNSMRRGQRAPLTFYFSKDLDRIAAAVAVQAWWRASRVRSRLAAAVLVPPLLHQPTAFFFPAVVFYVVRLQCCWRRIIAGRRARLLHRMRDIATLVMRRAEGASTTCYISAATITQAHALAEDGGRSLGKDFFPELQALLSCLVYQGAAAPTGCAWTGAPQSPSTPTGRQGFSVLRSGVTLRPAAYAALPNFLKAQFVPAGVDDAHFYFGALDLLVEGVQPLYFSYPCKSNIDTRTGPNLVVPEERVADRPTDGLHGTTRRGGKHALRRRPAAKTPAKQATSGPGSLPDDNAEMPLRERLVRLAAQHPRGHFCCAVQDAREAICRRLALVALTFRFSDESALCFEPRLRIVQAAAVAVIEEWWLRCLSRDASRRGSSTGKCEPVPPQDTGAPVAKRSRSLAPPSGRLTLKKFSGRCPNPFLPVPRVPIVKPPPRPVRAPPAYAFNGSRRCRSIASLQLPATLTATTLSSVAAVHHHTVLASEANRQHYVSVGAVQRQLPVLQTLALVDEVQPASVEAEGRAASPPQQRQSVEDGASNGVVGIALPVDGTHDTDLPDAASTAAGERRIRTEALHAAHAKAKIELDERRARCAARKEHEASRSGLNPTSLRGPDGATMRMPRWWATGALWRALAAEALRGSGHTPMAGSGRLLSAQAAELNVAQGLVVADVGEATVLRGDWRMPAAVLHRIAIDSGGLLAPRPGSAAPKPPTPRPVVIDTVTELPTARASSAASLLRTDTRQSPEELRSCLAARSNDAVAALRCKQAARAQVAALEVKRAAETRTAIAAKMEMRRSAQQQRLAAIKLRLASTRATKRALLTSRLIARNCHRPAEFADRVLDTGQQLEDETTADTDSPLVTRQPKGMPAIVTTNRAAIEQRRRRDKQLRDARAAAEGATTPPDDAGLDEAVKPTLAAATATARPMRPITAPSHRGIGPRELRIAAQEAAALSAWDHDDSRVM